MKGDGRCFFRCIAKAGMLNMSFCDSAAQCALLEECLADRIRMEVVDSMQKESGIWKLAENLPLLLDDRGGKRSFSYRSIDERITAMSNVGQYPGYLEIATAAHLMKRQVLIYEDRGSSYYLHAKIPQEAFLGRVPIRLAYTFDTGECDGHYNLITVEKETLVDIMLIGSKESLFENCGIGVSAEDMRLTLYQILLPMMGSKSDFSPSEASTGCASATRNTSTPPPSDPTSEALTGVSMGNASIPSHRLSLPSEISAGSSSVDNASTSHHLPPETISDSSLQSGINYRITN